MQFFIGAVFRPDKYNKITSPNVMTRKFRVVHFDRVSGEQYIVCLDQLLGARYTHISYHDTYIEAPMFEHTF